MQLHPAQVIAEAHQLELARVTEDWPLSQWAHSGIVFDVLRARLHTDGSVTVRILPRYFKTTIAS